MKATRKFYIRVRADYVGYYEIEAKDLNEAEIKAMVQLDHDMNDRVYPNVDCDEYDPTEFMENPTSTKAFNQITKIIFYKRRNYENISN